MCTGSAVTLLQTVKSELLNRGCNKSGKAPQSTMQKCSPWQILMQHPRQSLIGSEGMAPLTLWPGHKPSAVRRLAVISFAWHRYEDTEANLSFFLEPVTLLHQENALPSYKKKRETGTSAQWTEGWFYRGYTLQVKYSCFFSCRIVQHRASCAMSRASKVSNCLLYRLYTIQGIYISTRSAGILFQWGGKETYVLKWRSNFLLKCLTVDLT